MFCLNDVIAKLPYYLEKDSGKDVRELFPDVWKLEKSNTNTIGVLIFMLKKKLDINL